VRTTLLIRNIKKMAWRRRKRKESSIQALTDNQTLREAIIARLLPLGLSSSALIEMPMGCQKEAAAKYLLIICSKTYRSQPS